MTRRGSGNELHCSVRGSGKQVTLLSFPCANKFGINWEIKYHRSPASNKSSFEQLSHCTSLALDESSVDQVTH